PSAVDRQGPALVRTLRHKADAAVISPWDRGSLSALRPGGARALVLVDFQVPLREAMRETAPNLSHLLDRRIRPPVAATQSSFADISLALQEESLGATERA